jgi:hypothetical protein
MRKITVFLVALSLFVAAPAAAAKGGPGKPKPSKGFADGNSRGEAPKGFADGNKGHGAD